MNTHLAVDRYLRGTLADDELAEFEERLLWDEELRDEVDLAERLREGLEASVQRAAEKAPRTGLVDWLTGLFYVPQYAAAASFVLAVALTAGIFMSPLIEVEDQPGGDVMPTEIIPLIATRGTDAPTIYVDPDSWVVLLVDAPGGYDSFRVSVRRNDADEPFWVRDNLQTTYPEALAITVPGSALGAGDYVLALDGVRVSDTGGPSHEHVQDIRFRSAAAE